MINIFKRMPKEKFIPVDDWNPKPEEVIVKHCKDFIIMPIGKLFGADNQVIDRFDISIKRGYNSPLLRNHISRYINYFLNFYDKDKELLMIYANLKYLIDLEDAYTTDAFFYDIYKYILTNPSISLKIDFMNKDNYKQHLNYTNKNNPNLQYNNIHGKILMKICVIINILIPLVTHFAKIKKIKINIIDFLLNIYDMILNLFDVDIYSKLYETCLSNISRNKSYNPIWKYQDIRSINVATHTLSSINNILINIIPKYVYNKNPISLNYASIKFNINFQITDIPYEYDCLSLSSSKRDEDQNSEFDKFEASLTKQDESLYIQNQVNCEQTMNHLSNRFKISDNEVDFYIKELKKINPNIINSFQKDLIFNLFYKYFGDVVSIKGINHRDYVKLMIIGKKILQINGLIILPYIISSNMIRISVRKSLNKREYNKLKASPHYTVLLNNYQNPKIIKYVLSLIGTLLSSEFKIIEYYDKTIHGKKINTNLTEIICEEVLMYIDLIHR